MYNKRYSLISIQVQNYNNAASRFHQDACATLCALDSKTSFNKSLLLPINVLVYILNLLEACKSKPKRLAVLCDFGLLQCFVCALLIRNFTRVSRVSFYTTYYHHLILPRELLLSAFRLNEAYKLFSCILFRHIISFFPYLSQLFYVITVSPSTKHHISKFSGLSSLRIFCLYNSLFFSRSTLAYDSSSLMTKDNKLLVVSNLEARKNPCIVYRLIGDFAGHIKVVVPQKKITPLLQRLILSENTLYSDLPRHALEELYQSSSYVVIPSFVEGLSLVPFEAVANSAIAILSDIPVHRLLNLPDIQYFDPYSYKSLLETISKLEAHSFSSLLQNQANAITSSLPQIKASMISELERLLESVNHES